MTLIEIMIVVTIMGVVFAMAVPSLRNMREDQRVKSAVRGVADAFQLARAESIRTGSNHIVVMQGASGVLPPLGLQTTAPVAIIDDGIAATADCAITTAGEVRLGIPAVDGIRWGTSAGLAGANPVPNDTGFARANVSAGSSFTNATVTSQTTANGKFASWVLFQPDGVPRLMTPASCANVGQPGQGGGAIYLTNGRRDYAVVLSPLGTVRVHSWNPAGGGWSQ